MASAVNCRIVTEYIPGNGCGTVKAIKMLDRDATAQEAANGCVYITKEVSAFQPKLGTLNLFNKDRIDFFI